VDNFVLTATGTAGTIQGEPALKFSSPTLSFTGTGTSTLGGSQIYLNGGTSNRIDFNTTGSNTPILSGATNTRSVGEKINLYPKTLTSTACTEYIYSITGTTDPNDIIYYTGCTGGELNIAITQGDKGQFCASKGLVSLVYNNTVYSYPNFGGVIVESTSGNCQTIDYSLGVFDVQDETGTLWYTVPASNPNYYHSFYGGITEVLRINGRGNLWLSGGTLSDPIVSAGLNSNDTDTGLYFPAANSLGLVTGGKEIIRLSANTTSFSGGTVSVPSINAGLNSNDTNTGIYFPSGDTIGFATNASSRMLINNSGVGIGMTPTTAFQVDRSGIRIQVDATGTGINIAPAEWIHLSSDPVSSKYIQIDATQFSASPTEQGGSPDTAIGQSGNKNKYLTEPDYWIEIKLDAAGPSIVLIPCYVPG
jgi:hypothetical protein